MVNCLLCKHSVVRYECQIAWLGLIPVEDPQVDILEGGQLLCVDLTIGNDLVTMMVLVIWIKIKY